MVRMIVESATSLQYTQDGEYSLAPIWGFSRQKTGWEDILLLQHRVFWSCCCLSVESCNNLRSSLSTCFNTIEQSTNLRWFDTQTNPEDRESIYSRQFSKPGTKNSQLLMSNWHILIHMCLEQCHFLYLKGRKKLPLKTWRDVTVTRHHKRSYFFWDLAMLQQLNSRSCATSCTSALDAKKNAIV